MTRLLAAFVLTSMGCSAPSVPVCDPSSSDTTLRLGFRVVGSPGRLQPGEQVQWDNGYWFLYVDESCHYYVHYEGGLSEATISNNPTNHPTYEGQLTSEESTALGRDVLLGSWPDWAGRDFRVRGGFDYSPWEFTDGTNRWSCTGDCSEDSDDAWTARNGIVPWLDRLRMRGTPVTGPMRGTAVRAGDPAAGLGLHVPPEGVASSVLFDASISLGEAMTLELGQGTFIPESETATWRRLRDQYLMLGDDWWYLYIPARDTAGQDYFVRVRDTIPSEDANGLVTVPRR